MGSACQPRLLVLRDGRNPCNPCVTLFFAGVDGAQVGRGSPRQQHCLVSVAHVHDA